MAVIRNKCNIFITFLRNFIFKSKLPKISFYFTVLIRNYSVRNDIQWIRYQNGMAKVSKW